MRFEDASVLSSFTNGFSFVRNSMRRGVPARVELFAEEALEIAAVALADVFEGVAVNHDHGRIRAALVRKAGLRTTAAARGGC